ncbi:MAG: hypothetical protein ACM3PU_18305 [Gemmatimonadota bacterium]
MAEFGHSGASFARNQPSATTGGEVEMSPLDSSTSLAGLCLSNWSAHRRPERLRCALRRPPHPQGREDRRVKIRGVDRWYRAQDAEFFAAIRQGHEPRASMAQVRPCYPILQELERQLIA